MLFGFKTSNYMLRFLIFADFLSSMPNKAKNLTFYQIFDLIWHVIQKSAKTHKNEKTQHLRGRFKSKMQFKINF